MEPYRSISPAYGLEKQDYDFKVSLCIQLAFLFKIFINCRENLESSVLINIRNAAGKMQMGR